METPRGEGSSRREAAKNTKREQLPAACESCRTAKIKCDERQPCRQCTRRGIQCVKLTQGIETHRALAKRKYTEVSHSHDDLLLILQAMARRDNDSAIEIFEQIRAGRSVEALARSIRFGSIHQDAVNTNDRILRQKFLVSVLHSTASLREISDLLKQALDSGKARINLPSKETLWSLRDSILTLETLNGLLTDSNPGGQIIDAIGKRALPRTSDSVQYGPPASVPASPWTNLTDDDEAVSHLVSLFLKILNPMWRYVEEDLFLRAMRSQRKDSEFCSCLLVNAILASASLFSEIEVAYATPGKPFTRGEPFLHAATELWELERGRASVVNIQASKLYTACVTTRPRETDKLHGLLQALMILSTQLTWRGKDRLGLSLATSALKLHRALPSPAKVAHPSADELNRRRARTCVAWCLMFIHVSFGAALQQSSMALKQEVQTTSDLEDILPEIPEWWIGYPLSREPRFFHVNSMTRCRCQLIVFASEANHLLYQRAEPLHGAELYNAVAELEMRMRDWHVRLPTELRCGQGAPPALFEFHGKYYYVQLMMLHRAYAVLGENCLQTDESSTNTMETMRDRMHTLALQHAHDTVDHCREFRQMYGHKIIPIFVVAPAWIAIFVFIRDMRKHPYVCEVTDLASQDDAVDKASEDKTESGFEECFRLLLSSGFQLILPRAIARTACLTATGLNIRLPRAVEQCLRMFKDITWNSTNVVHLDTAWPVMGSAERKSQNGKTKEMEDLLRQWQALGMEDNAVQDTDEVQAFRLMVEVSSP